MQALIVLLLALATCVSTLMGGIMALAMRDRLHLILGYSAGAVIGLVFFDLLPEAIESGSLFGPRGTVALTALGFLIYTVLDRSVARRGQGGSGRPRRGWIGAASFAVHSFLDGFAIGIAFQVSNAVGAAVAVAVLAHDFSDGLNTVNVVVSNGGDRKSALRWLALDAATPMAGAVASLLWHFPEKTVSVILAVFAGFFLYIGASDLLPESHHAHPRLLTTVTTFLGAATLFVVTRIAG